MVAVTSQIKVFLLFFVFLLPSCSNEISINEDNLIDGKNIQQFIRSTNFSGQINVMYNEGQALKSSRTYRNGLKNGKTYWMVGKW